MGEHTGKRALITGASSGIGAATALTLARAGADVIINHFGDETGAARVAEQVRECGSRVFIHECDVSDHAAVGEMIADVSDNFGDIDHLINNAGITRDAAIWNLSAEAWDEVIAVNLTGCFNTINALAGRFRERKSGRIVNVASINGLRGKFGQANYSAAKAGIIALTRTVARELGKYSVTVNAVAPGMVLTEMTAQLPKEIRNRAREETALKTLTEPEDVAELISFLCSEKARHITGETIRVDAGQLA